MKYFDKLMAYCISSVTREGGGEGVGRRQEVGVGFAFQNHPKKLDLSSKTGLDFLDCFEREKS